MALQDASFVTTSGSIDGWDIEEHLGVVACHVVAGTGFFSDLLAGFSDLFGGRSEAYQRQLTSLYDEAITRLMQKANERGGNWLVGLRVDLDQVTGKGKQMFMITGLATVVRARSRLGDGTAAKRAPQSVLAHDAAAQMQRMIAIETHRDSAALVPAELLARWTSARIEELAPAVLRSMAASLANSHQDPDVRAEELLRHASFFMALPRPVAVATLFDGIAQARGIAQASGVATAAVAIVAKCSLGDLARASRLLEANEVAVRRAVLPTLIALQPSYAREDLATIDRILIQLDAAFPLRAEVVGKTGLFGRERAYWSCVCRATVGSDEFACGSCGVDRQGFERGAVKPLQVREHLGRLRSSLVAMFTDASSPPPLDSDRCR
jgi:uncharacterized protein YbjQ (UPF0145 family)